MHILIVGASRGLGLELVSQYRAQGADVTATARDETGLDRLRLLGADALRLDVADAAGTAAPPWRQGGAVFDTVVLNAGVFGPRTDGLQAPSEADFDAVMHTNVLGAMRLLPQVVDRLAPGARLAVISSRMGSMALRSSTAAWLYRASKAALNSVLKDVSLVLAGRAVCVALHPGWVRTDMGGSGADLAVTEAVARIRRTLAALQPEDNGAFLNVDGTPLAW